MLCPHCHEPFKQTISLLNRPLLLGGLGICCGCDEVSVRCSEGFERVERLSEIQEAALALTRTVLASARAAQLARDSSPGGITAMARGMSAAKRLAVVYKRADAATAQALPGTSVSCTPGCDACCHYRVHATPIEAHLIVEVVRARGGEGAVQRLAERARKALDETGHPADAGYPHARVACPLLEESRCSVYEARPVLCRSHWVKSDPSACEYGGDTEQVRFSSPMDLMLRGLTPLLSSGNMVVEVRDLNWQLVHATAGDAPTPWPATNEAPLSRAGLVVQVDLELLHDRQMAARARRG